MEAWKRSARVDSVSSNRFVGAVSFAPAYVPNVPGESMDTSKGVLYCVSRNMNDVDVDLFFPPFLAYNIEWIC